MFYQSGLGILKSLILLDSQSTVDVLCNPELIQSIHHAHEAMKIEWNTGIQTTNLIGDLPGYGAVWFDPEVIANILSLKVVQENVILHMIARKTVDVLSPSS